ncbi:hypothetical protein KC887_01245 [Candidatus Kaiserbacteria bacterium]|nr:hypothetical protein [Candidatus Kaiserbacteria bacterium]
MTTIAILQLVTIATLAAVIYLVQRNRFIVDIQRVADLLTAQLLADYGQDLWMLDERGISGYVRTKYMQMATEWGFPSAAVDRVTSLVGEAIKTAQGDSQPQTVGKGNPFYE